MSNIENITFGVEIECSVPRSSGLCIGYYHRGNPIPDAPTFFGASWQAQSDGSIRPARGHMACEFVSPILRGEAGVAHLIAFVEWVQTIGAKVNASCGFHVHLGIDGLLQGANVAEPEYVERLTRLVSFNTTALYAQTGSFNRRHSSYCAPLGAAVRHAVREIKRSNQITASASAGRYHVLNLTNLTRRRTVEFRCFAGTINVQKILLHVFSAMALGIIARTAKTPAKWDNRPWDGSKAVRNLLKVRPMLRVVQCDVFARHWHAMTDTAFRMAEKYDEQARALAPVDVVVQMPATPAVAA